MLEIIEKLLVLQDRDQKIARLTEELDRIPAERDALRGKTASSQAGLDAARKKVMEIESERKRLELDAESLQQRIDKYANQQLQTKKNDEYQALTKEIANCKRQIHDIEDREIECMEANEKAQALVKEAGAAAATSKQAMETQVAELDTREKAVAAELEELEGQRDNLAEGVDTAALSKYERLLSSKGASVLVGIAHGVCGGCHMKLPAQVVVSVRADQELNTCPNCGRILYVTRDMDLTVAD